ncbi:putative MFS family arabinose efflux permease [Geodermatophilus normandii]|uniref:Putative MFS family arabinose efflux permease n=1 Tax=Geodermatophilus normandii TaxID=1137989 RepID=A0A317QFX7_9ACTN|nr:MFS transporter [Geodermatophilus normandii]PWW21496.1 putative MFS family arabinose efflux permease [Geodermatophilus normandii]
MTSTAADPTSGRPAAGGRSPFRSLHVHNFRLYASANLVSLTGTWMQRIGQDWLVLQLSGDSGVALGLITALQFGPSLLLSMYGGVLADRYDKRRVLVVTQVLMGLLAVGLGLLVATGTVALWHVFVLAAGLGSVSAIDAPVRQAFVSEMVGGDLLANAVGLNSTIFNGARLVGPALAGLLIGASGGDTAPAFLVNAASFAFTIGALLLMRPEELRRSEPVARARGQLRAGLAYTWARPDLRLAMVLAFVIGTFGFNFQVTIALMAREVFDLGAEAFGLLSTTFAVGSLTGAFLSTRRSARPRQRFLVTSAVVFGLLTVACGLTTGFLPFAVLLVPTGAAALVFSVANNSFVQLGADPQMRGRVMALYFMCFMGGTPLGAPVIGWVSEHLGAPWGLILGGAVVVVAGALAGLWLARGRRVRLEAHVVPPRLLLHVGEVRGEQAAGR